MSRHPVIRGSACCLAHVPDLVSSGSKPRREIEKDPRLADRIAGALRPWEAALGYPPNQVFIGNLAPDALRELPGPWFEPRAVVEAPADGSGRLGRIVPQDRFYALLRRADVLEPPLFELCDDAGELLRILDEVAGTGDGAPPVRSLPRASIETLIREHGAWPIRRGGIVQGCFRRDERAEGREDENLTAICLLENLCAKASGALALQSLLEREGLEPEDVDFLIGCGEEACGDRYQRGGGGMAKATGEMVGCRRASGMDVKNFCAAPASALITAGALVQCGLFRSVVVVGGGSLAKLGMKFQPFLQHGMPILDDCLASVAFLVTEDDGRSPVLRLEPDAVGLCPIGASATDEAVYRALVLAPLEALGLSMSDVDRYAPELHNPEIMEHAGSGDVARKNYRALAALAVMAGQIDRSDMDAFADRIGMPGFAPTQGHVPSAVPFIGHAAEAMARGELHRVMFLAKASLFLGRCTDLYDGVSFLLESRSGRDSGGA